MLFFARESFPTYRVDIDVLFGKELVGRGHEIDFVMQAESPDDSIGPVKWRGRTVWVGGTASGHGWLSRALKLLRSFWHDAITLLRLARRDRYDSVQVRDKFVIGALASFVAQWRGLRYFYWLSFPVPESQIDQATEGTARFPVVNVVRGRLFGWLLYRVILPSCDHVFVQSLRMKEDLARHGTDPGKMTAVPMGIDLDEWPSVSEVSNGPSTAGLVVGYLGTLGSQRRLEVLIDALAILRRRGIDVRFLFVGGSDKRDDLTRLEKRATQMGVTDRIEITGHLPRAAALARMSAVDVALSPFYPTAILQSTSPTKLVECMAMGLPVVANTHPEQKVVLRDSAAGVCVPWGARHFARGIAWLAKRSAEERREIGLRGRAWVVEHRAYGVIASEVEATYQQVLSHRARAGSCTGHGG